LKRFFARLEIKQGAVADSKMLKKPLTFNKELVIKAGDKIDNAE
jgi:hypothetical protein